MKVNGRMTNETDMASKDGKMARSTKVATVQMLNRERVSSNFPMIVNTKASLSTMTWKALDCTAGMTASNIRDSGVRTKCTEWGRLYGQMVDLMWESTSTTKSTGTEHSPGQAVRFTPANGPMASNTESAL